MDTILSRRGCHLIKRDGCLLGARNGSNEQTGGSFMKLVPLEDRVVVKVMEQEEETSSGIVLPDTAKERPQKGEIVAAGPGKYGDGLLVPMPVSRGEIVVFAKYAGTEVKLDGEQYLVMRIADLIGVLRGD
jgi:chaperonin GroES